MGHTIRPGTRIRDYWPDDTETCFHLVSSCSNSLQDIIDRAKDKWGEDIDLDNISITSEKIHTHCLGYDQYDPSDYTDFIIVTVAISGV